MFRELYGAIRSAPGRRLYLKDCPHLSAFQPSIWFFCMYFSGNFINNLPNQVLRVKVQNFSIFGRPQRLHDGLRESNYTPKDADLYALSLDLFGFSLTAFPIWPLCDLLTKFNELCALVKFEGKKFFKTHSSVHREH